MSNEASISSSTEPVILAIETATRAGSVAVARDEKILASKSGDATSSHSTDLIENIDAVLREAAAALHDIDLFAVAVGPGSFTGLRIGLATVKSLAVSLDRKCVGVSTLAAIAQAGGVTERVVALLPAGRGEVFAQMFAVRPNVVEPRDEPAHLTPQAMLVRYGNYQPVTWAGEGAQAQLQLLTDEAQTRGISLKTAATEANTHGWMIADETPRLAEAVAILALREWRNGKLIDPEDLQANYVRASDAEIKTHA